MTAKTKKEIYSHHYITECFDQEEIEEINSFAFLFADKQLICVSFAMYDDWIEVFVDLSPDGSIDRIESNYAHPTRAARAIEKHLPRLEEAKEIARKYTNSLKKK